MQLVEVIRGAKTSDETVATVVAQAQAIGKKPIVVNDCAGFLVNRCLLPYMNEAVLMLEEGVDMQQMDKAVTKFGMPMGPVTLADMVGLDVMVFAGGISLRRGVEVAAVFGVTRGDASKHEALSEVGAVIF